jgi:serine/threonine protein kinase
MAPELLLDGKPPTRASDIYGLGVLLYRLVTRDYPVRARSLEELAARHQRRETVPLRDRRADLPPTFQQVVGRALDPDPTRRFASVGEMENALRAAAGVLPPPVARRSAWKKLLAVAIVALGLAAFGSQIVDWLPARRLAVSAELFKHEGNVDARLEMDTPPAVRLGDSLFVALESREDVHLYILNASTLEPQEVSSLFPASGLALGNPIPGGVSHRFPTDGRLGAYWKVANGEGTETLLLVASREPRPDLESRAAPRQSRDNSLDLDPDKVDSLNLRKLEITPPQESSLEALMQQLREESATSKDLWFQVIELECRP